MTPAEYQAELTRIINDTEHAALTLAMNELIAQKPILKGYEVEQGKNDMIDGNATMSLQWAGDAVFSIDANPALKYVIPEEGSNLFFDGWVIPKYAGNVKAANLFINYMCKPEIAIQNMDYIGYTSVIASDEVIEYLNENYAEYPEIDLSYFFGEAGKSVHADPNMFPEAETILRLAVMRDFGAAESKVNDMWNNVKSS
jgi:spermidine/putrescine transport system substrate-binding protein